MSGNFGSKLSLFMKIFSCFSYFKLKSNLIDFKKKYQKLFDRIVWKLMKENSILVKFEMS
jgi:hypothetical protein